MLANLNARCYLLGSFVPIRREKEERREGGTEGQKETSRDSVLLSGYTDPSVIASR